MDYKNLIQKLLKQIRDAFLSFITVFPKWFSNDFYWGFLIIPFLFAGIIYGLSDADIFGWHRYKTCKHAMEIIHPSLLALTVAVSVAGYLKTKNRAFMFIAVLGAFALFREIFGQGTTFVFIIGIIGLMVYGDQHSERISTLLESRWMMSLLAMCFICYILSQLLDRGVIKRIGWLILWDTSWRLPHSSNMEESLESLGGFFLLITSISLLFECKKVSSKKS
jgi:hypothetical protein